MSIAPLPARLCQTNKRAMAAIQKSPIENRMIAGLRLFADSSRAMDFKNTINRHRPESKPMALEDRMGGRARMKARAPETGTSRPHNILE